HLREQLGDADKQLVKNRSDIERLTRDVKSGDRHFVYCGRSYSAKQVESDLSRRFDQYKVKEATLGKLSQILAAREKGLDAGREDIPRPDQSRRPADRRRHRRPDHGLLRRFAAGGSVGRREARLSSNHLACPSEAWAGW